MWESRLPRPPASFSYVGNTTTRGGLIPDSYGTYVTTSSNTSASQINVTYQSITVQTDPHCPMCKQKMDKLYDTLPKNIYWMCPKCGVLFKPTDEDATEDEGPSEEVIVGSTSD